MTDRPSRLHPPMASRSRAAHDSSVSDYARLLKSKKIHYLPTCLIIETLTSVFGYIVRVPVARQKLESERPRVIRILELFYNDLACTLEAYESGRMQFFVGDWKSNRTKAQRIFTLFASKLRTLNNYFWGSYQVQLKEYTQRLEKIWLTLCTLLDEKGHAQNRGSGSSTTRYFHSSDAATWQKTMANIIAELSETTDSEDGEYLLLICCNKVRARLLKQIEQMQARRSDNSVFDGDCILCVSQRSGYVTCPLCTRFSDEVVRSPNAVRNDSITPFALHPAYQAALNQDEPEMVERRPFSR